MTEQLMDWYHQQHNNGFRPGYIIAFIANNAYVSKGLAKEWVAGRQLIRTIYNDKISKIINTDLRKIN